MAKRKAKLTKEQIQLAAEYLATSNLCTLDQALENWGLRSDRINQIKNLSDMKSAVSRAIDIAVEGAMEGMSMDGGGDLDRYESKAIEMVEKEIKSFRADLNAGGKRAKYWIETLTKEVPFLFEEAK
jgi:hypothetical protein